MDIDRDGGGEVALPTDVTAQDSTDTWDEFNWWLGRQGIWGIVMAK
jgi:hypothetical protein